MGRFASLVLALVAAGCASHRSRDHLVEQLDREVIALRQRNAALTESVAQCGTEEGAPDLYRELRTVFSGMEVQVEWSGGRTVVTIPTSLLFAADGLTVRAEAAGVLDLLATALSLHADTRVWVVGHTDDALRGPSRGGRTPWEHTFAEALAVMEALTMRHGLDPARFTVAGQGDLRPLASNDTPAGQAANRRIVVVIGPAAP